MRAALYLLTFTACLVLAAGALHGMLRAAPRSRVRRFWFHLRRGLAMLTCLCGWLLCAVADCAWSTVTRCLAGAGPGLQAGDSPCPDAGVSHHGGET